MYSTVMNTDHPKQSAAMNHGRPPRGGKAVVWDGDEGREGGRSEMRGVGISRATRGEIGCRGGRGAGSDGSACSLLWWDLRPELLIVRYRRSPSFATCLTRRESGEVGASPCHFFLGEAASINIAARAVFQGTTLDVAHSAGPRPSSPRRSPVDGIDRGSPPHRTRAPVLPLTRVPRPCTPWSLSIHRKGTSQL